MRSKVRTRVLCRLTVVLAMGVSVLVASGAPASAAVPTNDGISNATVITSLPFRDAMDISEATFEPSTDSDSPCSYGNGRENSVWYSFTPAESGRVAFDPGPSNGYIGIDVFTGSPGALSFVGCGVGGDGYSQGFILDAAGGTTYWIMASSVDCCENAPNLDLWVYPAVVPRAMLSVDGGTVDRGGNAAITGTLDCVGTVPNGSYTAGNVRQNVGRLSSVSAEFVTTATCGAAARWTALAQPSAGRFTGGPVTVNATAYVCNAVGCVTPSTTAVVTLNK